MDRILTLFSQAWLCLLAVGASAQVSFTSYPAPACGDPTISISSADNRNSVDTADNLLTRSDVEVRGTFWLAPSGVLGNFVVDLGCRVELEAMVRVCSDNHLPFKCLLESLRHYVKQPPKYGKKTCNWNADAKIITDG